MKIYTNAQSDTRPQELEIGIDTVFVRSNIHTITVEDRELYEYKEIQYTMTEYLRDVVPQLELAIAELTTLIAGGET